jgi:hypothetical protein
MHFSSLCWVQHGILCLTLLSEQLMMFFWVLAPCRLIGRCQLFGEHTVSIFRAEALKSTRRQSPEEHHHPRCPENLKFYKPNNLFTFSWTCWWREVFIFSSSIYRFGNAKCRAKLPIFVISLIPWYIFQSSITELGYGQTEKRASDKRQPGQTGKRACDMRQPGHNYYYSNK